MKKLSGRFSSSSTLSSFSSIPCEENDDWWTSARSSSLCSSSSLSDDDKEVVLTSFGSGSSGSREMEDSLVMVDVGVWIVREIIVLLWGTNLLISPVILQQK